MKHRSAFQLRFQGSRMPRYRELPGLELYKDQIVELTNQYLAPFFPRGEALTDTMVNNYVKLKVIAPPVKKRYSREQLSQLMLVCLLKKVLSIAEVRQLLVLQRENRTPEAAYDEICDKLEQELQLICSGEDAGAVPLGGSLMDHAVCSFVHKLAFEMMLMEQVQHPSSEAQ
jgi:hypothetical protein